MLNFVDTVCPSILFTRQGQFCGAPRLNSRTSAGSLTGTPARRKKVIECRRGGRQSRSAHGDGRRPNRVGELIRRELGPIIDDMFARAFRRSDSMPMLISIVDVKCSDDLRSARVNVSVFGTDEEKKDTFDWLRKARKEARFKLAHCVHLKHIPELSFHESEMVAAIKTVDIINKLALEREKKQKTVTADSSENEASWKLSQDDDLDYDASADDALIFEEEDDEENDNDDDVIIVDIDSEGEEPFKANDNATRRDKFNERTSSNLIR